jgi:hypothetical protein
MRPHTNDRRATMRSPGKEGRSTMYDRNEYDLRIVEHKQRTNAINGQAWKSTVTLPMPTPRRSLAKLLLVLAARLDPATVAPLADAAPRAPVTS